MQNFTNYAKRFYAAFNSILPIPNILFIMRLSVFCGAVLLLSANLMAAEKTKAQNIIDVKVTLTVQDQSLKSALKKLQAESGFNIFYSSSIVDKYTDVSLSPGAKTVEEALSQLLSNTNLDFRQNENEIIIFQKKTTNTVQQAEISVSGIVRDESRNPIPGVTVQSVHNRHNATATDQNGIFGIKVDNLNDTLRLSFVGYRTENVPLRGRNSIEITMHPDVGGLSEVQVIGYGKTSKRDNTGAVSSITAADLGKEVIDNPLEGLQGHIAGMEITQDNGLPGAALRVSIRGAYDPVSAAGYLPLYVIDGVPFTLFNGGQPATDNLNAYGTEGANGGVSPFSLIAPEDIERIDILKDADATAIYGSRGANGVVLITTKKGKQGKTVVNFNVNNGVGKVAHFIPMMNTEEYLAMRTQAYNNSGETISADNGAPDLTVWSQTEDKDWQKYFLGGTAHTTNATGTVSGGDANNTFLLTGTYRNQGTVFPGNYGSNTFSGRLSAGHKSTDQKFDAEASVNYTYMGTNLPSTDLSTLYNLPPNYPIYNADGSLNWTDTNPLSVFMQPTTASTTNLLTNLDLSYKLFTGFTLKANLGYSLTRLTQLQEMPASSQNPAYSPQSSLGSTDNQNSNYIIEPQAQYTTQIGKGKLDAVVGTTFQQTIATGIYLNGTGYSSDLLLNTLAAAGQVSVYYNNYSLYKYTAVFGRVNYNWDEKYIIDGTFRRDGSSRFGADNQFGNFGAIGGSWIFTQEDAMKNISWLNFGKLRASYGVTGNDQIPNYQYLALFSPGGTYYSYAGSSTLLSNTIPNPNLQWEISKKLDAAIELGFFKSRILLKADYYRNRNSDILTYTTVPQQTGNNAYLGNLNAVIQNKGWEFELTTINVQNKDFSWTTNINATINRNKLLSFPDLSQSFYANDYVVGQPVVNPMLFHYTGVDPKTGLPTFQDKNGDGNYDASDMSLAPYGHPWYGGLTNVITYKGVSLDFTFQYNHRMGYKDATLNGQYSPFGSTPMNQSTDYLNRWTAPGSKGYFPAANVDYDPSYGYLAQSDFNWGDASFLKLKTVSLNWTLPKTWVQHLAMSNAQVYLQGQNIATWAKQKYVYDPETTVDGTGPALGTGAYVAFPQLRTIVLGLNVTF
jgi:TonB-linked SusC/RagA family outer membrane protein